jgi:hypothetical protein
MSGLSNYAAECGRLLDELRDALTKGEVTSLHQECSSMGRRAWIAWISDDKNSSEIRAFVSATPSARNSKKKWQAPQMKSLLVLAAYHHVWQARHVLRILSDNPLSPGNSYRDMAMLAGEVYEQILYDEELEEWPFDGENPFDQMP